MATVRERAAALNLAEKLCAHRNVPGVLITPVQPSSLWCDLIFHLKTSVTVKRRRVHIRSHSDCFLGSEAVDVVAGHIAQIQGFQGGEGASVSRDRVVCVCQVLLDCKVFEAVKSGVFSKDKKDVFQDSKTSLYRFLSVDTPSIEDLERGMLGQGIQHLFCSAPSEREEQYMSPHDAPVQLCSPCVSIQTCTPVKAGHSWEMHVGKSCLSPSREHTKPVLPQSLVTEVWLEQTTLRLLNLVELPLLEGVLQCNQKSPSSSTPTHLTTRSIPDSNNRLDRQILKAFSDSQEDEWLSAAIDCLDFLPDQPVVELSREMPRCCPLDQHHTATGSQDEVRLPSNESDAGCDSQLTHSADMNKCKLLAYGTLVKHYSSTDRPLLPQYMTDVYTAITDLLGNAKLDKALEALQLCLKLLPPNFREELRRLLLFMALAADPQGIKLDKETENKLAVKKTFSRAILHSRALSKEQQDLMVIFMLSNRSEIFKIPGALHKVVSDKLASIEHGTQADFHGTSFCQQVPSSICAESTKNTTNSELHALIHNIHLDPKHSAKERKRLLGLFYQAHPEVFNHYFGDFAPGVL